MQHRTERASGAGVFDGDRNQIDDCSKDKCVVNGKQYSKSTDIPGNGPKPLLHKDGSPVLGPNGKPLIGPMRVDLDQIAREARSNWFSVPSAAYKFRHGGEWDFQRVTSDDGRPIFTQRYQDFANVAVGYVLGSLGLSADEISSIADKYCWMKGCHYDGEPKSQKYPNLAERHVKDYEIGVRLYKERHPEADRKK